MFKDEYKNQLNKIHLSHRQKDIMTENILKYQHDISKHDTAKNDNFLHFSRRKILSACACIALFALSFFGMSKALNNKIYFDSEISGENSIELAKHIAPQYEKGMSDCLSPDIDQNQYIRQYLSFFTHRAISAENTDFKTLYTYTFSKTDTTAAVDIAKKIADVLGRKIVKQSFLVNEYDENGQIFTNAKSISDLNGKSADSGIFFLDDGEIYVNFKSNIINIVIYGYTIYGEDSLKDSLEKKIPVFFSTLNSKSPQQIICDEKDSLNCIYYTDGTIDNYLLNSISVCATQENDHRYTLSITGPLSAYERHTSYSQLPLQKAKDIFAGKEFSWAQSDEIGIQLIYMPTNSAKHGVMLVPFYRFYPMNTDDSLFTEFFLPAAKISKN